MPKGFSNCKGCGQAVHVRCKVCAACGQVRGKGGRPVGTNAARGYEVSKSGGRPQGTTANEGYEVSKSGGRPQGTTANEGYEVSKSGGRPQGTTAKKGYGVSSGRPSEVPDFSKRNLPTPSTTPEFTNLTENMLSRCSHRVVQQRRFDNKALADAICWQCGKVLWSSVDSVHTFLVDPPQGMCEQDAPACAYLNSTPNCHLTFVKRPKLDSNQQPKWYACSHCHTSQVPTEMHVGDIFSADGSDTKPVIQWDMQKPQPVTALQNRYETGQVSLAGLFSTTVRDAGFAQWKHVQGEVNALHKLDRHYYGLFGFLACKEESIQSASSNPQSSLRIHRALKWFKDHNHLYDSFFSNYETLFRYAKPGFINPDLLECQDIPLHELLGDEAEGMAFPVDSRYFDQFPLIFDGEGSDEAGLQHPQNPQLVSQGTLQALVTTKYGEQYLEPKSFPHLHPWGFGGWHYKCELSYSAHIKMRLFDVRGWFAEDPIYTFFKYDYMTKRLLRGYASRRTVRTGELSELLNARKVRDAGKKHDRYDIYGVDIPRTVPGSLQHWKSFGLDLTAMVTQRGLPDFFVTLSAYDCWPQTQATLAKGWGSSAVEEEYEDLARTVEGRQPVGYHPQVSVMAAEKRFQWMMRILASDDGPLGCVEDYIWKKEYQKRGAVHWHMLFWVKPGTVPDGVIMAEVPRPPKMDDEVLSGVGAYLRRLVLKMLLHGRCTPSRCFKGAFGKYLPYCKYGFPFKVPQLSEELDEDCVRYIYVRRQTEDKTVVPYNPEIAILWGASHNVQRVSKHGFEQYLAKYISKAEPSCKIDLPESATLPQRYLRTRIVGAIEAIEVLMGFHQSQMTRQVTFLHTELSPNQRMLKHNSDLYGLQADSQDIYVPTRFHTYLVRSPELAGITYPEYYQWWRRAASGEQKKAESMSSRGLTHSINPRGKDDSADYQHAKSILHDAQRELACRLEECSVAVNTTDQLLALLRCALFHSVPLSIRDAICDYYQKLGIKLPTPQLAVALPQAEIHIAEHILEETELDNLADSLAVSHWLMQVDFGERLRQVLERFPPGTMLKDKQGRYWVRRAKMAVTRHRFLSPVGDSQEKYYEQKYLLSVCMTDEHDVYLNPPQSWLELCVREGLCDAHVDALSSLQSAISRGFNIESLRELARLYIEHRFITDEEADGFLSNIPVLGDRDTEPQVNITDQLLSDPESDLGTLVPSGTSFSLDDRVKSFTNSQRLAYDWVISRQRR